MKYYQVTNSAEARIVGTYPQTSGLFEGYDHTAPTAMENLTSDEIPDFIPDLRFELDKKAYLTDIVSPSNLDLASGLLMNQKSKEAFMNFKVMPHNYFSATLRTTLKDLEYFWLHIFSPYLSHIDIPKSSFWEILPSQEKVFRSFTSIANFEKYFEDSTNRIIIKQLILDNDFEREGYDMICLPGIFSGFLMSEELCSTIKSKAIVGLSIKEQAFY